MPGITRAPSGFEIRLDGKPYEAQPVSVKQRGQPSEDNQVCLLLRKSKEGVVRPNHGLNRADTEAVAESLVMRLSTRKEANAMLADKETNRELTKAIKPKEFSFLHDPVSESLGLTAIIVHVPRKGLHKDRLAVMAGAYACPKRAAPVAMLQPTPTETEQPQQ
jgi:hypothetical protein